ncbi:MAG: hypothetical protein VX667_05205, partial [Nitrospinota bacterium]|nr:hypothetical protein [Nitrospinota bacterium]
MIESSIKTLEEKNFDRVRLDLQGLLNRDENDIEAMYCMGLLMAKTDRLKEVQELSNKAIKIDPEFAGP